MSTSINSIAAIADQDWMQVETRKQRIAAQAELNATLAAERMTDKLQSSDDIPLNTLVPTFGVAVDKMLALRGDYTLKIQHELSLEPVNLNDKDLIAYAVALSNANEQQREWLKSIGPHKFARLAKQIRESNQQAVIEPEIVQETHLLTERAKRPLDKYLTTRRSFHAFSCATLRNRQNSFA